MSGDVRCDAIVLGAGVSGLRALYELGRRGLSVRGIEAAPDVGGTWYWNRYPGSRTDSEAWAYCYGFSPELVEEWDWADRLPSQEQVYAYLGHVADRFDLRDKIDFDTRIKSAAFDEEADLWILTAEDGRIYRTTYFVAATGVLSAPYVPDFAGIEQFEGECHMAALWPGRPVDFAGKRVAIVGSGSTGIQLLPLVAASAAHVSLLQRTPNYVLPSRNHPIEKESLRALKTNYPRLRKQILDHPFALPINPPNRTFDSVATGAERIRILELGWEAGGFRFMFETFDDIFTDLRTNNLVTEFIRNKIRTIVTDPATAESLCPDYVFGAKRPPTGTYYYEAFNRENVTLVDVRKNPIRRITPKGIALGDTEMPFDMIIFATGFDAAVGAMSRMDVRGVGGLTMQARWADGAETYLGLMVDGFPNLMIVQGPQSPFGNAPPVIEAMVDWIADAIDAARQAPRGRIEPTAAAVDRWISHIHDVYAGTLFSAAIDAGAWFMGANIPDRKPTVLFHFGGTRAYLDDIGRVQAAGYEGIDFS